MASARAQASARKEILRSAVGSVVESLERRQLLASVAINFQTSGTSTPSGYLADSGATYASRGNGYSYGWNADNSANTANDGSIIMVDTPYKTYAKMQPGGVNRTWEIGLANGSYQVKVVAGDYQNSTSVYDVRVEGQQGPSGAADPYTHWFEKTVVVNVNDGKLTISNGSNASDQRIAFVQITDVASLSIPSTTAANLVARAASNTAIDLVWDDTTNNEYGFEVQRKLGSGSFTTIATVGGGNEYWNFNTRAFFNDTGLTSGEVYTYRVRPVNAAGTATAWSNEGMVDLPATNAQAAYNNGVARPVTSRIEAEDFDIGGPAFGYTDNSTGNYADLYRRADVDVGTYSGGYFVGWNSADEWTAYTVSVPVSGTYDLTFARSRSSDGGTFQILQDGARVGPESIQFLGTGNAFTFATTTVGGFYLNAGTHILTLKILTTPSGSGEAGNIDWLQFNLVTEGVAQPTNLSAPSVTASSVQLTWTDNASNETSYTVQRKTGTGAWATLASGLPANTASYTDNTVSAGSDYTYQVIAVSTTLGSSAASNAVPVTTPSNTTQYTLNPSADSYVRGSSTYENDNYGTAQELLTKLISSSNKTNHRETFFKFDTSGQTGNVTSAVLRVFGRRHTLVGTDPNPINFEFRAVQNTTWTESGITYANKPTIGTTVLGTVGLSSTTDQWYEVDITSYLQQERAAGRNTVSIAVVGTYSGSDAAFYIKSKEHANKPELVIQTQAALNPPAAPTSLAKSGNATATGAATVSVPLTWVDNANNETGFVIRRSTDGWATHTELATVGVNTTAYTDGTAAPDATYSYRVYAQNADGLSTAVQLDGVDTPPKAPVGLQKTDTTTTSISILWENLSDTATTIRAEKRVSGIGASYETVVPDIAASESTRTISSLLPETQYDLRVRAINGVGDGWASSSIQVWTKLHGPSELDVEFSSATTATVSWVDESSAETGYELQYSTDINFLSGASTVTIDLAANAEQHPLSALTAGTAYYFRVRAVKLDAVNGQQLSESDYTPVLSAASPAEASIVLPAVGITGQPFQIQSVDSAALPSGSTWSVDWGDGSPTSSWEVGQALPSHTYASVDDYVVEARLTASNGDLVAIGTATAAIEAPADLGLGDLSYVEPNAFLVWWDDNSNNEANFEIHRRAPGETAFSHYRTAPSDEGTAHAFRVDGLAPDTTYDFIIYAVTASGVTSASSNIFTLTTASLPVASHLPLVPQAGDDVQVFVDFGTNAAGVLRFDWKIWRDDTLVLDAEDDWHQQQLLDVGNGLYRYDVLIRYGGGSEFTASGQFAVGELEPTPPPTAPTSLLASSAGIASVQLNWQAATGDVDGYAIERSVDGGDWEEIDVVYGNSLSYTDHAFVMNASLKYQVRAFNSFGHSSYSNEAPFASGSGGLSTPGAVSATALGQSTVQLGWSDTSSNESGFLVEVDAGSGFVELARTLASTSSYVATGLTDGTTYTFRVSAVAAFGSSTGATSSSVTTHLAPPSLLVATVGDHAVTLSWNDESSSETYYKIQYSEDGTSWNDVENAGQNATQATVNDLEYGKTYLFRIRSANGATQSGWVGLADVEIKAPRAQEFTAAAISSKKIVLGLDPATPGLEVQRSNDGVSGWETITLAELSPEAYGQYGITGLSPQTTYFLRARHDTDYGTTDWSSTISASTLPLTAPFLYDPYYESEYDYLSLYWDHVLEEEEGFRIEVSTDGTTFTELGTTGTDQTWYEQSPADVLPETVRYFRAITTAAGYESEPSNTVKLMGAPASPTGFSLASPTESEINAVWTDNTGQEFGYQIEWWIDGSGDDYGSLVTEKNASGYTITGRRESQAYRVRVRALAETGGVSEWAEATVTTGAAPEHQVGLHNTGVSSTGELLAGGSVDGHFSGGGVVVQATGFPVPNQWAQSANAQWIGPQANQDIGNHVEGTWTYTTSFDMTGIDRSNVELAGLWSTDNTGVLELNGQPTGYTLGYEDWSSLHAFRIDGTALAPGQNTLSVTFTSDTNNGYYPNAGAGGMILIARVVSLLNTVSITSIDSDANEPPNTNGDTSDGKAVYRVSRTGDTTSSLSVLMHPSAGTAISGADFALAPDGTASVTIPANQEYVDITLTAISDPLVEGPETATLILKASSAYRLANVAATASIADAPPVDLDNDSDNRNGLERSPTEDEIEDTSNDPGEPGKISRPNIDDGDNDKIPAFADGFNLDASIEEVPDTEFDNADSSVSMAQMVLSLPAGIHLADASIEIVYSASNPSQVTVTGDGTEASPFIYTLPTTGVARIWTGTNNRVTDPLSSRVVQNGVVTDTRHFFVDSTTYSGEQLRKLGFTTDQNGIINNSITLYVEGVKPSTAPGDVRVVASLTTEELNGTLSDAVRFMFTQFDLDIDSDNTSTSSNGLPERTSAEDDVEDEQYKPGKVIIANTADKDVDGIPDLADGFNGLTDNNHDNTAIGAFVPVIFELPDIFDPELAELTLSYSASDPNPSGNEWLGTQFSQAYNAADGHMRLWTSDASAARSWQDLRTDATGTFVGSGTYSGEALARLMALRDSNGLIKLYVEGIRATDASSGAIQVSLKMNAADSAPTFTDQVRVTVVNAVTPEARDSLISTADGSFQYESRDFDLPGWTENFGHGLLFTNAPEYVAATGAQMSASTADWPKLVNGGSSMMVLIGGQSIYFDRVGIEWKSRFGLRHKLAEVGTGDEKQFKLVTAQGETWIFNGFSESLKEAQRGALDEYLSIGGQSVQVSAMDAEGHIAQITRGGVALDYTYETAGDSKGELKTITAKRGGATLYTVTYTYYLKNDTYGNAHDVKSVKIKMGANVVERKRFFYTKSGTDTRSTLMTAIEGRNYARAVQAGIDPATATSPAMLASYADFVNSAGSIYTPSTGTISLAGGLNPNGGVGNNAWTNWQVQTIGNLITTVFSNAFGQPLMLAAKDAVTKYTRLTSYRYDSKNNLVQEASPAAVATYDQSKPDLVGYTSETAAAHLRDNAGLITRYIRNADGLVESEYLRNGDLGTDVQLRSFTYVPVGADSVQQVATVTDYVTEGANPITRTTAYNYQNPAHNLPTKIITTRSDGKFITKDYNAFGRLEYVTDADDYIHHTTWDNEKGVATSQVTDEGGLNITTQTTATDAWGRATVAKDALGHTSSFEYSDGFESSQVTATLPDGRKSETTSSWQYGFVQTLTKTASGTILNARREHVDHAGRTTHADRYFRIPAGNSTALAWGSASTNSNDGDFHRVSFVYDTTGNLINTVDGIGTSRETKYDAFGRATDQLVNGALTHKLYYFDLGATGATATVTQAFANASEAPRGTTDYFDWRGRKVASENGVQLSWISYSNLDEALAIDIFDQAWNRVDGVISGVGVPRRLYEDAGRVSRTVFGHDALGRVATTEVASVDASSGTFGAGLITMAEYDGRGNVVRATSQSGLTTETITDGAGRQTDVIQKVDQQELSRAHQEFDANGYVLLAVRTDNGPAGVRRSYVRTEYDEMGRPTASVDFGTNGGSAVSATMALPERVFADGRNAFLRTDWSYDDAGEVEVMTDARGVQTKNEYDALGRTTKTIGNFTSSAASDYTDSVQTFEYNGVDQVTVTKTSQPGGGFLRSERFYDTRGRLTTVHYPAAVPGTSGGLGNVETYSYNNLDEMVSKKERSDVTHTYTINTRGLVERDQVSFPANTPIDKGLKAIVTQYDALGRMIGTKNQGSRGGAIKREYNGLGQLLREWQDIDGDVDGATPVIQYHYGPVADGSLLTGITYPSGRHISYGYTNSEDTAVGRPTTISDSGVGGVVEQYEYLGLQQVIARSRPEANASQAFYGRQGAIDLAGDAYTGLDRFGRVVDYGWQLGGAYEDRFQYEYDAGSNVLSKNNLVNPAFGELFHRGEDVADASGGNPANIAYDHFGRLEYWMRGQLGSTGSSARLNDVAGESVLRKQYWVYDHGGNWKQFYDGRKKHVTAFDSRQLAINATQGSGESGENPATTAYEYNAAGTLVKSENGISRGVTYDGWGRAVTTKVYNGSKLQGSSTYYYDPLGRPVLETSTSQWSDGQTFQAGYSEMYHDLSGHMIEEVHGRFPRESGAWRRDSYVWGVDGKLVSMEQGPTPTNPDKLRFSVFDDGMGNTTSVAVKGVNDPSYALAERYVYDPHGQAMVLTSGWTDRDLVASTVLYDNNPLNPSNYSKLGFRYLFGQQRWFQADRLYHSVGGTYDPILTMSAQPSSTIGSFRIDDLWGRSLVGNNMLGRYIDTNTALLGGYGSDIAGASWGHAWEQAKGVDWAAVGHTALDAIGVVDPFGIADGINGVWYLSDGDYLNAAVSFMGLIPYAGDVAKVGRLGKTAMRVMNGLDSARSGVSLAMHSVQPIAKIAKLGPKIGGHAMGSTLLSMGVNATVGGTIGFVSAAGGSYISSGNIDWSLATRAGLVGAGEGLLSGVRNPYICFVAGTQVVVAVEEDGSAGGDASAEHAEGSTATATRVRYKTVAIETLVARGGGEMGDGRTSDGAAQVVLSRDQHDPTGPLVRRRITRTYQRTAYALQVLTLRDEDGNEQTLRVTEEHPFYVDPAGWTPAKSLESGDMLLGADGTLTVVANEHEAHPNGVTVYNLEVEQAHTYFVLAEDARDAAAVWVHNASRDYALAVDDAIESGAIRVVSKRGAGIERSPRHHVFAQGTFGTEAATKRWFSQRGVDIDRITVELDKGVHEAIHKWVGSAGWNSELRNRLLRAERALDRQLNAREIWEQGYRLLRQSGIRNPTFVPYKG